MSVNQMILSGNTTSEPETRFAPSGTAVTKFTVAHTPRVKDKQSGQWTDGTALFQDCVAFGNTAETIAENVGKGQSVVVTGNVTQDNWDDKQTGAKRSKHVLVVSEFALGVKRVKSGGQQQSQVDPSSDW